MQQRQLLTCPNCGAIVTLADGTMIDGGTNFSIPQPEQQTTLDDIEAQLTVLIERALASAIPPKDLVHVLSEALTFVVEYTHPSHQFFVEVVDLGTTEEQRAPDPYPDLPKLLRRYVGRRSSH